MLLKSNKCNFLKLNKKIFLIIFFVFSLNCLCSQKVYCVNCSNYFECLLVNKIISKYVCDTNITIIFDANFPLSREILGITNKYSDTLYVISINVYLNDEMSRVWTIMHEIGHLIDMVNGKLSINPLIWEGKIVKKNIPYPKRPWEESAESWANFLFLTILVEAIEEYELKFLNHKN